MIRLERAPAEGVVPGYRWETGDRLARIGESPLEDILDFYYLAEDEGELDLVILDAEDRARRYRIDSSHLTRLAEAFAPMEFKTCAARCVFCFIDQNPEGMRDQIYVKDEDYRLSFLYGNYITLTSLGRRGVRRVIEQRLSPLFVSVHATDVEVRTRLLDIKRRIDVMAILRELTTNGIEVHTQIVLCPDWNDGEILQRSLEDLGSLHPGVASIAVVPVGLSEHREGLTELRAVGPEDARRAIKQVERWGDLFREREGVRLAYVSDEFYLRAGLPFPPLEFYGDLPQEDNGVGQARAQYEELAEQLPELRAARRGDRMTATILTGTLAAEWFERDLRSLLDQIPWLDLRVLGIPNRLYGEGITVSGLLPGKDFLDALQGLPADAGRVLLPDTPLNHQSVFLDDLPLAQLVAASPHPVEVAREGLIEALFALADSPSSQPKA